MSDQHDRFQDRLRWSLPAVMRVAWWYVGQGTSVEIPGMRVAPSADQHEAYSDGGDLFLLNPRRRVEVHRYRADGKWTDQESWPYKELYLRNYNPKVPDGRDLDAIDRFVIVNEPMTHAAIVYADPTRSPWLPRYPLGQAECTPWNTNNEERKWTVAPVVAQWVELRLVTGQNR